MKATSRLARLLALVPYLVARPGVPTQEVADVFGVTEEQLRADLDLLFMCGLPGYTPGDLIEVSYQGDRITVSNADTIARPLRLTPEEALALVVAGRTLAAVPGLAEHDALDRAVAKIETACQGQPGPPPVEVVVDDAGETLTLLEHAVDTGTRVHLRYHSASRDEITERDVDPMRLVTVDGRWYLEGWCRNAEDVRLFRLDRVLEARELDRPAEVPPDAVPRDLDDGLFQPSPEDRLVTLRLAPAARWVGDYYPCESVAERPGGGLDVALRVREEGWLLRLLLRLGERAAVVDAPDVAAAVRAAAEAALVRYAAD